MMTVGPSANLHFLRQFTPHRDYTYTFADSSHNPWRLNAKPEKPFLHKSEQRRGTGGAQHHALLNMAGVGTQANRSLPTRYPKGQEA